MIFLRITHTTQCQHGGVARFKTSFSRKIFSGVGFDAAVQRLDRLFRNEIAFRMVGPLPPYSFSAVDFEFSRISEAFSSRPLACDW